VSADPVPSGVEAFARGRQRLGGVVQRIGHDTWDLILIDAEGAWERWVLGSKDAAQAAARSVGVEPHDGWTEDLSKLANRNDDWNRPDGRRRAL
jgi:hypothetical protein